MSNTEETVENIVETAEEALNNNKVTIAVTAATTLVVAAATYVLVKKFRKSSVDPDVVIDAETVNGI